MGYNGLTIKGELLEPRRDVLERKCWFGGIEPLAETGDHPTDVENLCVDVRLGFRSDYMRSSNVWLIGLSQDTYDARKLPPKWRG